MKKSHWLSLASTWLSECLNMKDMPRLTSQVVCLALGSFSPVNELDPQLAPGVTSCVDFQGSKQSQYQLIFFLDVLIPVLSFYQRARKPESVPAQEDHTDSSTTEALTASFYDPAFTEKDKENLRKLGHVVLNEEPNFVCKEPTFFYIPHAPKTLYERLIKENSMLASGGNLRNVVLLGNDLKGYQGALIQEDRDSIPALMQINPQTIQTHYPPDLSKLNQAAGVHFFNEVCLQWFRMSPTEFANDSVLP